jgi:hypothetical protein
LAGRKNKVVVEKLDFIQAVERAIAVSLSLSLSVSLSVCMCVRVAGWCCDCRKSPLFMINFLFSQVLLS